MIIHNGKKYKLYKNGKEYKYVPKRGVYNLYIGGIGAYINSKLELATKLGTTTGNISDFAVVGQEVRAFITNSFELSAGAFTNDNYITYFIDLESKITQNLMSGGNDFYFLNSTLNFYKSDGLTSLGRQSYQNTLMTEFYYPNLTRLNNRNVGFLPSGRVDFYTPNLNSLGSGAWDFITDDANFYAYLPIALQGDPLIDPLINAGSNVIFIQNITPPNPITDLTATNVGGNDWQFNFTVPSITNTIKNYRVFAFNGTILSRYKYFDTILNSGDLLTLPSNTSSVWIQVADQYLNLSNNSNIVKL